MALFVIPPEADWLIVSDHLQKSWSKKQQRIVICDKNLDKLAADKRRQPQTFSPADLAGLKLASLRDW